MTSLIVNHKNTKTKTFHIQENGTQIRTTLRNSFLPENKTGGWSLSVEEASCNFRIPLVEEQVLLQIRSRVIDTVVDPTYIIPDALLNDKYTTFTCSPIYSIQQFFNELHVFFLQLDRALISFGYNNPNRITGTTPLPALPATDFPLDWSDPDNANFSGFNFIKCELQTSDNISLVVHDEFFEQFFIELGPVMQHITGWSKYIGAIDDKIGSIPLSTLEAVAANGNRTHNQNIYAASPDNYKEIISPFPIVSRIDQRVSLELHMTLPLPNKMYAIDGKESKRFILHSFDLNSENNYTTGLQISPGGRETLPIYSEKVNLGNYHLDRSELSSNVTHLLPGDISTIYLDWLILRYDRENNKYETKQVIADNDSRFNIKLLFIHQE